MLTLKYKKKKNLKFFSYIVDLLLITFITTSIFKLFFSPFLVVTFVGTFQENIGWKTFLPLEFLKMAMKF